MVARSRYAGEGNPHVIKNRKMMAVFNGLSSEELGSMDACRAALRAAKIKASDSSIYSNRKKAPNWKGVQLADGNFSEAHTERNGYAGQAGDLRAQFAAVKRAARVCGGLDGLKDAIAAVELAKGM